MDFLKPKQRRRVGVPQFLGKIFTILENNEFPNIILWSEDGQLFLIKNWRDFQDVVLPTYFKHKNYQSFLRQLNMYSFVKKRCKDGSNTFKHKSFQKGRRELLCRIKRRNNGETQEQTEEGLNKIQTVSYDEQQKTVQQDHEKLKEMQMSAQRNRQQIQQALTEQQILIQKNNKIRMLIQQFEQQGYQQSIMFDQQIKMIIASTSQENRQVLPYQCINPQLYEPRISQTQLKIEANQEIHQTQNTQSPPISSYQLEYPYIIPYGLISQVH